MNILALGNFILLKEDQPDWPEGKGEGLENSIKNDDNNLSAYPPDFIKKLRKIFRNDFPATRGRIIEAGEIKIERPAGNSTWEDFSEPENIKKIFEFPEALKSGSACPEDLTTAVTRAWNYTEAAKISYPLILKLIKLGMKYPINYTLEEKVPESVYAMF
jgi:hypothetical protein